MVKKQYLCRLYQLREFTGACTCTFFLSLEGMLHFHSCFSLKVSQLKENDFVFQMEDTWFLEEVDEEICIVPDWFLLSVS